MNNIQYPGPQQEYKVLVRCFTYNQSKYIEDALNGFVMQQTNFPFVCLVMDDASTDGEQDVIRAWMERECDMNKAETIDIPTSIVIIVPHKTNTSCTFAFYLLKYNLYGTRDKKMNHVYPWREKCEYEALCEGDDYWIDPLKLQKQVDFLENNPEYGLVHTNYNCYYQRDGVFMPNKNKIDIDDERIENLLSQNTIATLTTCFRCDIYNKIPKDYLLERFRMGDYPMWIEMSVTTKIKYLSNITAVYRFLDNSASHFRDIRLLLLFNKDSARIREYYSYKYNFRKYLERAQEDILYWDSILKCVEKERFSSLYLFFKSKRTKFKDVLRYIKYFLIG